MKSCKHEHDLVCDRCNLFPAAVHDIESIFGYDDIPQDKKEEMKFIVTQAKKNIEAWKAHILRSVNQDQARLDTLDKIDHTSVLVILDWAMKFIPRRCRESQTDWFGKRDFLAHQCCYEKSRRKSTKPHSCSCLTKATRTACM